MSKRVYVAASSADIGRAEYWIARLRSVDIQVTSSWPEVIRAQPGGNANPRDASQADRADWASICLGEVMSSTVLWLLVPPLDRPSRGCWVEAGYADACGHLGMFASGDFAQTVFTARGNEFAADEDAFAAVLAW